MSPVTICPIVLLQREIDASLRSSAFTSSGKPRSS
jgi:hypothetical protein